MLSRLRLGLPLLENEYARKALFADVAQEFLNGNSCKFSTVQGYTNILNKHWLEPFGNFIIGEIRPSHIKSESAKKDITAKTKKNILGPLSGVFEHAIDEGYEIKGNPCDKVKIGKHQKPKIDGSSPAKWNAFYRSWKAKH